MKGLLQIKLDEVSRKKLLDVVKPRFTKVFADHVTLVYGDVAPSFIMYVGKKVPMAVTKNCWNEEIQAVCIDFDKSLPCENIYPHITISAADKTRPVKSNEMLASTHESIDINCEISGLVEFVDWNLG